MLELENNDNEYVKMFKGILANGSLAQNINSLKDLDKISPNRNQCVYVYNFNVGEITFSRNAILLGFSDEEITLVDVLEYHPEDEIIVRAVTEAAVKFAYDNEVEPNDCVFCLTYRLKKKDGTYLKVLRETTVFDIDSDNKMCSSISTLTDISFVNTPGYVNWTFDVKGLDKEKFDKALCEAVHSFFTKRERELIPLVITGATSQVIAEQQFISKNTVDTHRRSIMRKSGCGNTIELLEFATRNKMI